MPRERAFSNSSSPTSARRSSWPDSGSISRITPMPTPRWLTCLRLLRQPRAATYGSGPRCGWRQPASTRSDPNSASIRAGPTQASISCRALRPTRPPPTCCVRIGSPPARAPDAPASNVLGPHRLAIGLYRDDADTGQLVRTDRFEVDVADRQTPVPELVGMAQSDLVLANDDDLTYCKLRLDERSLHTLRTGGIARLAESLPRGFCWSAAWDMTRDGELATRDYVALVVAGARSESDIGLLQTLNAHALRAVQIYADPDWAPQGYQLLAVNAVPAMWESAPGSDHQLAWAHAFLAAARSFEHTAEIRALYTGDNVPPGLALDTELRWAIVQALSARDAISDAEIDAELERDPSATGKRHAVMARAMEPTEEAKAEAWRLAVEDDSVP